MARGGGRGRAPGREQVMRLMRVSGSADRLDTAPGARPPHPTAARRGNWEASGFQPLSREHSNAERVVGWGIVHAIGVAREHRASGILTANLVPSVTRRADTDHPSGWVHPPPVARPRPRPREASPPRRTVPFPGAGRRWKPRADRASLRTIQLLGSQAISILSSGSALVASTLAEATNQRGGPFDPLARWDARKPDGQQGDGAPWHGPGPASRDKVRGLRMDTLTAPTR